MGCQKHPICFLKHMFTMRDLLYILIILFIGSIFIFNKPKDYKSVYTKSDTIKSIDTIYIDKPIPKYIKTKPDTIYLPSLDTTVTIERETKIYGDSTYECQISGFKPSLDYIHLFPTQTTIYKEKVLEIEDKQPLIEFKPSIGIGYGLFNNKVDLFVGGSLILNF